MDKNISKAIRSFGSASALARALGVTTQAVCFWRDGLRKIPAEQCSAIERVTAGEVTRRDLRPDDWHLVWPELADTPDQYDGIYRKYTQNW